MRNPYNKRGCLYRLAGVDDPYEEPLTAEVVVQTDSESPEESAARILAKLEEMRLIVAVEPEGYSEEDEEEVRRRLEALGYV